MTEQYDVVVVGGGIHGVGVAQAAACDGYSVMLLEQEGLASGTSSRSSKLIHGGLRYLEGYDFGLVRESLTERKILLQIAPDLVRLQPFHIPIYPDTSRRPLILRAGLSLYALLGGLRAASRFSTLPRQQWDTLDGLDTHNLQAVFRYFDAQTNDASLTRTVMQSALDHGAVLNCPAEFTAAQVTNAGCAINYRESGIEKQCEAKVIINAAGPWATAIDALISPQPAPVAVDLVQGAHLVLQESVEQGCYYMEAPRDRRAIFLLPWGENSMLGTTEHGYSGNPRNVVALEEEENYLLEVLHHYFPQHPATIIDRFAGLRVLPAARDDAFKRSRETRLPVDNKERPRVLSIYGGKLTGYRATAQKVMHKIQRALPERKVIARTDELMLKPVD